MAITEKELQISNKSYTNKDFESIYLEMLELAEILSKRFSPTNSNESDPFVVLLKLVAFVGDKINYNVDKNILERFMVSCTQEKSMRELTAMLGYNMHYYKAASTDVIFKYSFLDEDNVETKYNTIEIPKFSIVTNGDDIQYVTTRNAIIKKEVGVSELTPVLQGKKKTFTILGNEKIQLENISNNKLYFPELYVAQNGVFIINENNEEWEQVDNLNTVVYGSCSYKFGFDTLINQPYLEFPEWLPEIIGSGLTIDYIVTDGSAGNVGVKELINVTRIDRPEVKQKVIGDNGEEITLTALDDKNIYVVNSSAATNGMDIETIEESYQGFKKVVGTFDTLITCRDYANYIYRQLEEYTSNNQVADRRNDINNSLNVVEYNNYGATIESETANWGIDVYGKEKKNIKANDLCMYVLKPLTNTNYTGLKTKVDGQDKFIEGGYDDAYRHLTNISNVKNFLENSKTMSHEYKDFEEYIYDDQVHGDLLFIKDNYILNAVISTSYKVNIIEQLDIQYNIKNALIKNFNSRTIDWGEEIPFDSILNIIVNADSRITNVSLMHPDHELEFVEYSSNAATIDKEKRITKEDTENYNFWIDYIITKNIIEGRVAVFDFDEAFKYDFTEKNSRQYSDIKSVTTQCNFDPIVSGNSLQLQENQCVQFIAPNLITGNGVYGYGIHYNLHLADSTKEGIQKGADYALAPEDYIAFLYCSSDDNETPTVELYANHNGSKYVVCTADVRGVPATYSYNIISPNVELKTIDYYQEIEAVSMTEEDLEKYRQAWNNAFAALGFTNTPTLIAKTLETNDEVTHKLFNEEILKQSKYCYWYTNSPNNEIEWVDHTTYKEYLLKENEYFFYSDLTLSNLYSFSSGTTLRLEGSDINNLGSWTNMEIKDIEEIAENGLSALKDYFIKKAFSSTATLKIVVNNIITLVNKNTITPSTDFEIPDNNFEFIDIDNADIKINYSLNLDGTNIQSLPDRSSFGQSSPYQWKVRALLDLNCGPETAQSLVDNEEIIFNFVDDGVEPIVLGSDDNFKLSLLTQIGGGEEIPLDYLDINFNTCYPILYTYEYEAISEASEDLQRMDDDFYSYICSSDSGDTITLNIPESDHTIMMIYRNDLADTDATVEFSCAEGGSINYLNTTATSLTNNNLIILEVVESATLTISITEVLKSTENVRLHIHKPLIKKGNNKLLKEDPAACADYDYAEAIKKYFGEVILNKFYATGDIDSSKLIDLSNRCYLDSPRAFLDYNNVANKWVIGKIDFVKSTFDIAANCKLNK